MNPHDVAIGIQDVPDAVDREFKFLNDYHLSYVSGGADQFGPPAIVVAGYSRVQTLYHLWLVSVAGAVHSGTSLSNNGDYQATAQGALLSIRAFEDDYAQQTGSVPPLKATDDVGLLQAEAEFDLGDMGVKIAALFQFQSEDVLSAAADYMLNTYDLPQPANP